MCDRRSRVTGSMVWYSSSIPMVKVGNICVWCGRPRPQTRAMKSKVRALTEIAEGRNQARNIITTREKALSGESVPFPVFLHPLLHDFLEQGVRQRLVGRELDCAP